MPTKPAKTLHTMKLRMTVIAHVDAGLGGAVLVAADGDRVHAPAREGEQHLDGDHDDRAPRSARSTCPPPKIFANVPISLTFSGSVTVWPLTTWVTFTVFDVTSAPGIATGWAWEMISVRPPSPSSMPSVVMNDDTPMISVKTPLMIPTTAQHSSARIRHSDRARARPG